MVFQDFKDHYPRLNVHARGILRLSAESCYGRAEARRSGLNSENLTGNKNMNFGLPLATFDGRGPLLHS